MQNFNGKVRQYLKENERKKRSRLFGVVLSVVMTVSVLASLVMPAISATEGTSVAGGDVSYNGGSYSYKDANSVTIKSYDAVGSGKDQSKKIEFNVEFNFDKGAMTNRYIYFLSTIMLACPRAVYRQTEPGAMSRILTSMKDMEFQVSTESTR